MNLIEKLTKLWKDLIKMSKMPEFNQENLTDSYVCFIDILGFSKEIDDISSLDKAKATEIGNLLYTIKYDPDIQEIAKSPIEILSMSDSIVITHPVGRNAPEALRNVIVISKLMQMILLDHEGFRLSRGYLTKGLCHNRDGIVFGPSYIKAYRGEQRNPDPKIIIDPEIDRDVEMLLGLLKGCDEAQISNVLAYENGPYFINFLHNFYLNKGRGKGRLDLNRWIKSAQERIHLFKSSTGVAEKYQWFTQYARHHLSLLENESRNDGIA